MHAPASSSDSHGRSPIHPALLALLGGSLIACSWSGCSDTSEQAPGAQQTAPDTPAVDAPAAGGNEGPTAGDPATAAPPATAEPIGSLPTDPSSPGPSPEGPGGDSASPASFGYDLRPPNPTCLAPERPRIASAIALERVYSGVSLSRPLGLFQAPGDPDHWYAIEQGGAVKRFETREDASSTTTVFDLSVAFSGQGWDERGLLGLAFHPDFQSNGYVFLSYNPGGGASSVIDRLTSPDGGASLEPSTRKTILELDQPYNNHNGGGIVFGPDGLLYIGFGDGGDGGDPQGNGQNTSTLLGTVLRIDVDVPDGQPYAIPSDNPFVAGGGREEIFAWGLRNPWRFSFDRETGDLWAADVGQNCWEEVNIVERGKNYGWNTTEGFNCFAGGGGFGGFLGGGCSEDRSCTGFADPVVQYPRSEGQSITGGHVYRGSDIPALQGTYLYGDYASGTIWGLSKSPTDDSWQERVLARSGLAIASFAESASGEIYVLDVSGSTLHKVVASDTGGGGDALPRLLSETGCFQVEDPTQPVDALIPYRIRAPFWSDGAEKERWLALPDGSSLAVDGDGDWSLPPGGVSVKTFWLGGRRVETRFFVRHPDGTHSGYTYTWNADQSDATLLDNNASVQVGDQTWYYPSRSECATCHTRAAGFNLGLENQQLATDLSYPGGRLADQLATLRHIEILPDGNDIGGLPDPTNAALPLEQRARAYLHSNCAGCHRPEGTGRGPLDLRYQSTDLQACNVPPTTESLGMADARLLVPGNPDLSLIQLRMARRDSKAMPPLASQVADTQGVALIRAWISGLQACP